MIGFFCLGVNCFHTDHPWPKPVEIESGEDKWFSTLDIDTHEVNIGTPDMNIGVWPVREVFLEDLIQRLGGRPEFLHGEPGDFGSVGLGSAEGSKASSQNPVKGDLTAAITGRNLHNLVFGPVSA